MVVKKNIEYYYNEITQIQSVTDTKIKQRLKTIILKLTALTDFPLHIRSSYFGISAETT